jgi:drug/metabolite transporter (DMT)-like permease
MAIRRRPVEAPRGTFWLGLLIGVIFAAEFLLLYEGIARTTAARAALFLYATPFLVAIGAHLFLPGDRLSGTKLAGLIAAFAGLGLAVSEGLGAPVAGRGSLAGDLLCFAAAVGWASVTIIVRATPLRTVSPEMQLAWQLWISALILLAVSQAIDEPLADFANVRALTAFAYTAVIVAFISYVTWFWLLSRHPASQVSAFTFLVPIFGGIAGHLVLGEALGWRFIAALGLVAVGIFLVNRPARA